MELLDNQKQNQGITFSCGNTKVTFDDNGYIVKASGFTFIMWCSPNQDENLIGKHIIELAKLIKKYTAKREIYINFLENVVLEFYELKAKAGTDEFYIREEKEKKLIKT